MKLCWHQCPFDLIIDCKKFKDLVDEIAESLAKDESKVNEDGSSTAGLLEKLTVSENKSEEGVKGESTESGKEAETKSEATHLSSGTAHCTEDCPVASQFVCPSRKWKFGTRYPWNMLLSFGVSRSRVIESSSKARSCLGSLHCFKRLPFLSSRLAFGFGLVWAWFC